VPLQGGCLVATELAAFDAARMWPFSRVNAHVYLQGDWLNAAELAAFDAARMWPFSRVDAAHVHLQML